jgi:hypothetical protein
MSERPRETNSVLFSLRELRRIEDDRVKKEQDEARARAEAERAAKEAAERAARDAEERRRLDDEERARRAQADEDARQREDAMRLQEAERRARVEGEVRINEERMRLDAQHRAKHSPVKAVVGVAAVLVLIGGGLGYKMYSQHQDELAKVQAEKERIAKEAAKSKAELESRIAGIEKDMNDKLAKAGSDAERERIRAEAAQAKMAAQQNRPAKSHQLPTKTETPGPVKYKKVEKRDIPDDPTLGL